MTVNPNVAHKIGIFYKSSHCKHDRENVQLEKNTNINWLCSSLQQAMDDDEPPQLPADTLRVLQEFHQETDERTKRFENLKNESEDAFQNGNTDGKLSMDLFGEDWNASQFWYTDETARLLAEHLLDGATETSSIAVVSAPSVYIQLRNILSERKPSVKPRLCLLEYDKRFEVVGSDFVFYDYQQPLNLPTELKGALDRIICDPPFLSEDCQAKTALTARYLAKQWSRASTSSEGVRFITCTGERMEQLISKLYGGIGVKTTTFEPAHSKGLSNEFRCYANFESAHWQWR